MRSTLLLCTWTVCFKKNRDTLSHSRLFKDIKGRRKICQIVTGLAFAFCLKQCFFLSLFQFSRSVLNFLPPRPRSWLAVSPQTSIPTQPPSSGYFATGPSSSSSSLTVSKQYDCEPRLSTPTVIALNCSQPTIN